MEQVKDRQGALEPDARHSDRARFIQGLRDVWGYQSLNDDDPNDTENYALIVSNQYRFEMGDTDPKLDPNDGCGYALAMVSSSHFMSHIIESILSQIKMVHDQGADSNAILATGFGNFMLDGLARQNMDPMLMVMEMHTALTPIIMECANKVAEEPRKYYQEDGSSFERMMSILGRIAANKR